jgi:hypothetical protein
MSLSSVTPETCWNNVIEYTITVPSALFLLALQPMTLKMLSNESRNQENIEARVSGLDQIGSGLCSTSELH